MMTTVSIAQRLCRRLKIRDVSELPADDALEVADAISVALRDYYDHAPGVLKRRPFGGALKAADATRTVSIVNGATVFGWVSPPGPPPSPVPLGASVAISGDSRLNKLRRASELLFSFDGVSGDRSITIYGDTIRVPYSVARLVTQPKLANDHRTLAPLPEGFFSNRIGLNSDTGEPYYYWLESIDPGDDVQPFQVFRVWPMPDRGYDVTFDVELYPERVTLADTTNPRLIKVPDEHLLNIVLPLAEEEISLSPLYIGDKRQAVLRGERARKRLSLISAVTSPEPNYVGTPVGW